MCETSNTPAPVRTATCSWRMPSYCTGISHPANGTRRAPAARWRSWSGVRRRVSAATAKPPHSTDGLGASVLQERRRVDVVVVDLERAALALVHARRAALGAVARRAVAGG